MWNRVAVGLLVAWQVRAASDVDAKRLAAVASRMQQYVLSRQTAGTVTILAHRGKVIEFDAVGYKDLESKQPMQKDTLFRIASLTKPVTCAGIMVLADEGLLSVADPVEKYLPGYKAIKVRGCQGRVGAGCEGSFPSRAMTIEDLMAHTSGLPSDAEANGEAPSNLAELAALGYKTQLLFEPGTNWNYSNVGYNALGRIIEVVSGKPFDQFLQERIFTPLDMKDTFFFVTEGQRERVATLYTLTDSGLVRAQAEWGSERQTKIPRPAGGIVSTAEDMLRFNLMIRNKGTLDGKRVLSNAAVTLMTTSHTGDMKAGWVPGVGHGYGYEVVRSAEGMFRYNSIGTAVKGGAYRTYEFVDAANDLTGVFMMQLTNGGGDMADEINSFIEMGEAAIQ